MFILPILSTRISGPLQSIVARHVLHNFKSQKVNLSPIVKIQVRTFGSLRKPIDVLKRFQQRLTHVRKNTTVADSSHSKVDKITNNVLLYKHTGGKFYRIITMFGVMQIICLGTAAINVYTVYENHLFKTYETWAEKIEFTLFPYTLLFVLIITGPLIATAIWILSVKSVKYIILLRGGQKVQFSTYHPLKGEDTFVVPLKKINCRRSRVEEEGYIKVEVKDKSFHYIIDRNGEFPNPILFDQTLGMKRTV